MKPFLAQIETARLIAILRAPDGLSVEAALQSAQALQRGGVLMLEITLNTPGVFEGIAALRAQLPDLQVGAGTVTTADEARDAIEAGAQFLVTPTLELSVLQAAREREVPVVCGAYTPTEVLTAHRQGAALVKVFPSSALGPTFIRDLRGPLPFLKLVAVGGVTPENAPDFLRAGGVAVGAGSALFDAKLVAQNRYDELEQRARLWVEAVRI